MQKAACAVAGDFDHAAIRKKGGFHVKNLSWAVQPTAPAESLKGAESRGLKWR